MAAVFSGLTESWKSLDYVCGWLAKFRQYSQFCNASAAFVATNSINQGEQVARLWPLLFDQGIRIIFAHTSFKWSNLASHNAGVTVVIVGLSKTLSGDPLIFEADENGSVIRRAVKNINPYLVGYDNVFVSTSTNPISDVSPMINGSKPVDGGHLSLNASEARSLVAAAPSARKFVRPFFGSDEFIKGKTRFCIWVKDEEKASAENIRELDERFRRVSRMRGTSEKPLTRAGTETVRDQHL